jgi:hypothetical protein
MKTYPDLYEYVYLMAAIKLLREHGVKPEQQNVGVHNVHPEHPATPIPAKHKSLDHDEMINIRALTWIVDVQEQKLDHYYGTTQLLQYHYPTFGQQNDQASFSRGFTFTYHTKKESVHCPTIVEFGDN